MPTDKSSRTKRITILAHAGFFLVGIANTMLGPVLPVLADKWSLSDAQAGRFFLAQFGGAITGSALSGLLMRRLGVITTIAAGYGGLTLAVLALSANDWLVGLASFVALGFSLGLTNPATNLLVAELRPERRAAALNLLNLVWGFGAISGPPLVALVIGNVLWALGGLSIALASVALAFARGASRFSLRQAKSPPLPVKEFLNSWLRPFALLTGTLAFVYVGTETAIGGWIAAYTQRIEHSTQPFWALATSLFWAGLLIGRAASPLFLRHVDEVRLALIALAVAFGGMAIIFASGGLTAVSSGAFLAGLGLAPVFPNTVAIFTRYFGERAEQLIGSLFVLASLGGATLPWLVGSLSTHYGALRAGLIIPLLGVGMMLALQTAIAFEMRFDQGAPK